MLKRWMALFFCALMSFALLSAAAEGVAVTDMYGRRIALDAPATRVVALSAADCEILCALGAQEALIARGEYCDHPASIQALPVVQSGANTNLEELLALAPQVVLMSDMAQSKEIVEALEANGVRVAVSNADDIAGVYTAIRMIGGLMGREAQAENLVADMHAAFDAVSAQSQAVGKTVYFEVSPLQWGLWTAGSRTFMDELAAMCGLTNIFADVEGWAAVSEEQVLLRDPDVIVTIAMELDEGLGPVEEILGRPGWAGITAVQNGAVFNANADSISRPGPRLLDAAWELYGFLNR